jgi:hypothetical protein
MYVYIDASKACNLLAMILGNTIGWKENVEWKQSFYSFKKFSIVKKHS